MNDSRSAAEIIEELNAVAESATLEAKEFCETGGNRTLLETVCSLSNEPGLGGGTILWGVEELESGQAKRYSAKGIPNVDKAMSDLVSQCASVFNSVVHVDITPESVDGTTILRIYVPELPVSRKPLYFKVDALPRGAYRRSGGSDIRCTIEDIGELFGDATSGYDATPVRGATLNDVDESAIKRYRDLRREVNPAAEELVYDNNELLEALNCVNPDDKNQLNVAGLLLFGSAKAQRRFIPMNRVDYIRVPGTEWVSNPDSFASIDMRGSLLLLVFRVIDAINADLPRGFLLKDDEVQAKGVGLPVKVLREAVVNALMHGSYREGRPIQVIRYDNRIEITNAGYSLKPEERLGMAGSVPRNKVLAPVFHDTNLAETKGTGIRRMDRLMRDAHLARPTYESDREGNSFTLRLLLHHFLGEDDLKWLAKFSGYELDDNQKNALIFLREAQAVNNSVYRQLSGLDTLRASVGLTQMRDWGLLAQKGKASATYYVAGERYHACTALAFAANGLRCDQNAVNLHAISSTMQDNGESMQDIVRTMQDSEEVRKILAPLQARMKPAEIDDVIVSLCGIRSLSTVCIARLINRDETYVRTILKRLIESKRLDYTIPGMIKHPNQAYVAVNSAEMTREMTSCESDQTHKNVGFLQELPGFEGVTAGRNDKCGAEK